MYPQGYFPFPDGVLDPFPKEFATLNVMGLARGILADGGFDRLNMLADALMEAGCEDTVPLLHLQQEKRPRMCACAGGNRRANADCPACVCGRLPEYHSQTLHKIGQGLDCGCWQGTCWVVNWILGAEQKVLARVTPLSTEDDQRVIEVPVVNPAGYFGRCWLIAYTDGFNEWTYLVEAAEADDAIEEWVMSEFGVQSHIAITDLKYYEIPSRSHHSEGNVQHSCSFAGDGTAYDSDNITVTEIPSRGRYNRTDTRVRVIRYYGPGLPHEGVDPVSYFNFGPCCVCGKDCHSVAADLCVCSQTCARQAGDEGTAQSGDSATSDSAARHDHSAYTGPADDFPVYGGHD